MNNLSSSLVLVVLFMVALCVGELAKRAYESWPTIVKAFARLRRERLWHWITIKHSDHRDPDLKGRGERLAEALEKRAEEIANKPKADVTPINRRVKL